MLLFKSTAVFDPRDVLLCSRRFPQLSCQAKASEGISSSALWKALCTLGHPQQFCPWPGIHPALGEEPADGGDAALGRRLPVRPVVFIRKAPDRLQPFFLRWGWISLPRLFGDKVAPFLAPVLFPALLSCLLLLHPSSLKLFVGFLLLLSGAKGCSLPCGSLLRWLEIEACLQIPGI